MWHGKRARWEARYRTTHTPALRSAHAALEARSRRAGLWDARTHHKLLYGSRAIGAAAAPAGFHLRRGGGRPRRRAHARAYPLILTDLRGWDRPDFRPRQSYVMLSCPTLWFSHHCSDFARPLFKVASSLFSVLRIMRSNTYAPVPRARAFPRLPASACAVPEHANCALPEDARPAARFRVSAPERSTQRVLGRLGRRARSRARRPMR